MHSSSASRDWRIYEPMLSKQHSARPWFLNFLFQTELVRGFQGFGVAVPQRLSLPLDLQCEKPDLLGWLFQGRLASSLSIVMGGLLSQESELLLVVMLGFFGGKLTQRRDVRCLF